MGIRAVYGSPPMPGRCRDQEAPVYKLTEAELTILRGPRWMVTNCALCGQFLRPRRTPWQEVTCESLDDQRCNCGEE
jgi:hypothetical protein